MLSFELDRLRLFVAIVEEGSLTEAAKRLHMTQPAASRGLKQLEEVLGELLFERVGRGLVLNSAGRALLPGAYGLLAQAERLALEVRQAARSDHYNLRLGTTDSVANYLLPLLAQPLRARFEGLQLQWSTARSASLLEQVRAGELDVAIVASSLAPAGEDVRRLGPYRMSYYGLSERFAALKQLRDESQLSSLPMIELVALPGQPSLIADYTTSYARVGSLATVKALVMAGFGVGALLDFMLEPQERALLTRAELIHDPDCGLFLVRAPRFASPRSLEIVSIVEQTFAQALSMSAAR